MAVSYYYYPPFARYSEAKYDVFVLLHVFLFGFLSTISRQPSGRFTPNFAYRRILVPHVSPPFLEVSGSPGGGAEKGGNEILVILVNGEFLHFGVF